MVAESEEQVSGEPLHGDGKPVGKPEPSAYCECWFSLNTGPNGECEKCGKPPSPERLKEAEE